jgi:hypothetical protein
MIIQWVVMLMRVSLEVRQNKWISIDLIRNELNRFDCFQLKKNCFFLLLEKKKIFVSLIIELIQRITFLFMLLNIY